MAYSEKTKVVNSAGVEINPATEEQIILLRRIVKLLESTAAADIGQRQRVSIDAAPASLTIGTLPGLGSSTQNIGSVNLAGMDQKQFIDIARNTYANSIRSKLSFS